MMKPVGWFVKFTRSFGWSDLLRSAKTPTYVLIALPILAALADFLGVFGQRLPARTLFSVAGGLILLIGAFLIRWRCPKTIVCTQSIKELEDQGGVAHLKDVWREELNRRIDDVGLSDVVRTLQGLLVKPYVKTELPLDDDAQISDVLILIDKAQFVNLGRMIEAVRANFEHIDKGWQVLFWAVLRVGWLLAIVGLFLSAVAVFKGGSHMAWLMFQGKALRMTPSVWTLIPDDEPRAKILMKLEDVELRNAKPFVRQDAKAIEITVPSTSPARLAPTVSSSPQCPGKQSRCLGGLEYCCDKQAIGTCNGLWDFCELLGGGSNPQTSGSFPRQIVTSGQKVR